MKSVTINLNPETREELYSDIDPDFLAHILIEGLVNVVQDLPNAMAMFLPVVDDSNEYAEDPDSNIMASVEYLLEVLKTEDANKGVDVTSDEYVNSLSEFQSFITVKLCDAIESIMQFNDTAVLMAIGDLMRTPGFQAKLNFSATHLGNTVLFVLSGLF